MKIKNCPECGKIYVENPAGMCPDCYRQEEQAEQKVAEYLREVKRASLEQIHAATGVKHRTILRMIRRGRIQSCYEVSYSCETCGQPITEGRVCIKCSTEILRQAQEKQPLTRKEEKNAARMYTKDMLKK